MKPGKYDRNRNFEPGWNQRLIRDRGEDIHGEDHGGEDYSGSFHASDDDEDRVRPLSGFRQGDRGNEDITDYGRVDQYNLNRGRSDSYRYPETWRTGDEEGTNDWWQRESRSRQGYSSDQERSHRQELHRGKGPKNYQRSDIRIIEDVNERLADDPFIDASDIEVSVNSGNVILAGEVDSRDAKRKAEDISESVSGVKNVENRLHIKRSPDEAGRDGHPNDRTIGTSRSNVRETVK